MLKRQLAVKITAIFAFVVIASGISTAKQVQDAQSSWVKEDFVVVSQSISPKVAFDLRLNQNVLLLAVDVEPWKAGEIPLVSVGLSAAKKIILSNKNATISRTDSSFRFLFSVPTDTLVSKESDWKQLRLGMAVSWPGGALGQNRQQERFRHLGRGATHSGLSPDPSDWMPFDLKEYSAMVADQKNRIFIDFRQPMDGKATIVLEDKSGRRIRNLIAGKAMSKGRNRIQWDGLDEHNNVVAPGTYRWRAISHPGIKPVYLFSFCNDPGPNHTCLSSAVAGDGMTFFGAPCTEGGYAMMSLDTSGKFLMNYNPVMGTGIEKVALAADGEFLYAAHDGYQWCGNTNEPRLTLTRFNVKNGDVVDFPGGKRFITLNLRQSRDPKGLDLGGMALVSGKIYVGSRLSDSLLVVDARTGEKTGEIRLVSPGAMTSGGGMIYVVSGNSVVKINIEKNEIIPVIPAGELSIQDIALDASGNIYLSDGKTSTVKVYSPKGVFVKTIGKPGCAYSGVYDAERMINPKGLAVASNGWVWVTEDRWTPKRLVAWDLATGKVVREMFGPTRYGAGDAGFDAADHSDWIGLGTQWHVDFSRKTAVPRSILGGNFNAMHYSFVHSRGRTFIIGFGGYTFISELQKDGSVKDLAFVASTHRFCFAFNWNPPAPFITAFNKAYPDRVGKHGEKGPGVLWVDKNGDGQMQPDEFDFAPSCENFAGAYWGHDFHDLTIRVPATVRGKRVLVTLKPEGFYPGGAPKYPDLNKACLAGKPIELSGNEVETSVDSFGNMICNSDPEMTCFSPSGKLVWTYPNKWTNVHGSHAAPLPETGVMQGVLFFLGMAPFDEQADIFMLNGNHGRFFVMTSDGFYLDEMFKDVRLGGKWDIYTIGGECFGGFFAKSAKDRNYYLQSGSIEYRVFRIDGINQAKRSQGSVTVVPAQVIAAERSLVKKTGETSVPKESVVGFASTAPSIDAKENDWTGEYTLRWDKSGQFPVMVRAAYDEKNLYLYYVVEDSSPWVNNGRDWTLLFKTGDSVDLQIGTDNTANPDRIQPVPGDLRLLIAPFQGQNIAVLYRHRVTDTTDKDSVTFASPWRSEKVDSVKRLENVQIAVEKENNRYRVEASIPLSELGLVSPAGKTFMADFGALYGDADGKIIMLRSYWSNQATNLVNDVPGEIMLTPSLWGRVRFRERSGK